MIALFALAAAAHAHVAVLPPVTDPDYRASGPGWALAVDEDSDRATFSSPSLKQQRVTVRASMLRYDREPGGCEDARSGLRMPDTVTVTYARRTWRGCGESVRREGRPLTSGAMPMPVAAPQRERYTIEYIDGRQVVRRR